MQLGIDFGTSLSSAALWRDGRLLLVKEPLRHGYSFPTSVYLASSGDILVGQAAENQRLNDPGRYRREFKRELGGAIPLTLGDRPFLPEDLVAAVLRKLKREAENLTGGAAALTGAVITVPADYQSHKRGLMERAAHDAGFGVVTLLEEPVAAALTYTRQAGEVAEGAAILVYDLGGGTFDVALLRRQGSSYTPIAVPLGLERCGGIDFDRAISRDLLARFPAVAELIGARRQDRESQRLRAGLIDFCREVKHVLSETEEVELPLPLGFPAEGYTLSRVAFTTLIEPYLTETLALCRQIVQSAGLQLADVAGVLMVGGSCRMPPIQAAVATLGRPVWRVEEPELAVCQGAALYATLLATPVISPASRPPDRSSTSPVSPTPARTSVQPPLAPVGVKSRPTVAPLLTGELLVAADGTGQFSTISAALLQAGPGAIILVQPGRYAESLTVERPVTLLSADPAAPVVVVASSAPCLTLRAEEATLRGFSLSCAERVQAGGPLVVVSIGRVTLENCELIAGGRDGFVVRGAGRALTLRRCRIAGGRSCGGRIEMGAQATLEECQVADHAEANLHVAGAGTSVTLRRCQISGGRQDGVRVVSGAEATLEECVIHDNADAGIRTEGGATITLRACVLQGNRLGFATTADSTIVREGTTSLLNGAGNQGVGAGTPHPPAHPPARQGDTAPPVVAPVPERVPLVLPVREEAAAAVVAPPRVGLHPPALVAAFTHQQLELVSTLAFSPDGRWLLSGDRRGQLWLWDVARRQMIRSFALTSTRDRAQAGGVCAALFDAPGTLLISSHHDTMLRLWDSQTARVLHQLSGHSATVRALALSPDDTFLASAGDDRNIFVWWLPTRQTLGTLQGHTDAVTSLAIGPGEPMLASGAKDRTVRLWDLRTGALLHTLAGHEDHVRAVRFDPTGQLLASCSNDGTVRLWDVRTGQLLQTLSGHQESVYALAFVRDGLLVSGGWDQRLILWDTATGRIERDWSCGADQWVAAVAVSPVAPLLASAGYGGQIKLWEL